MRRRTFLGTLGLLAVAPFGHSMGQESRKDRCRISGVEIWRLEGETERLGKANRQHQVQPLHIYPEHRPQPYQETETPERSKVKTSAVNKMQHYYHFEEHSLHPTNGLITLPQRPGFGIELDESRITEKRSMEWA